MDHHCIWIDNCVGAKNQKLFIVFLYYAYYFIIETEIGLFACLLFEMSKPVRIDVYAKINAIAYVVHMLVGYYFCVYISGFWEDQMDNISDNQTTVESY